TANLAFDYDREVMAFPGRVNDVQFAGCNRLIKHHKAHLVESAQDIAALLNWDVKVKNTSAQMELPLDLSSEEQRIFDALRNEGGTTIDSLSAILGIPSPILVGILLEMELKNVVRSLPGKLYELV
ncbi:MAG: DNA-protecting protein DprA, partial [Bacteroidia bacterium]|nr:DNA-protecting protein DprA [Bacteroidia bacterium]